MEFITTSADGPLFAPPGFAFEKKRLADHGGNGRRLKWLGDEESRFRAEGGWASPGPAEPSEDSPSA